MKKGSLGMFLANYNVIETEWPRCASIPTSSMNYKLNQVIRHTKGGYEFDFG